jgi:hypothetical protein
MGYGYGPGWGMMGGWGGYGGYGFGILQSRVVHLDSKRWRSATPKAKSIATSICKRRKILAGR